MIKEISKKQNEWEAEYVRAMGIGRGQSFARGASELVGAAISRCAIWSSSVKT